MLPSTLPQNKASAKAGRTEPLLSDWQPPPLSLRGWLATDGLLATEVQIEITVAYRAAGYRSKKASRFILISPLPNSMTAYIGGSIE